MTVRESEGTRRVHPSIPIRGRERTTQKKKKHSHLVRQGFQVGANGRQRPLQLPSLTVGRFHDDYRVAWLGGSRGGGVDRGAAAG
jgi:ribosome modulation factor